MDFTDAYRLSTSGASSSSSSSSSGNNNRSFAYSPGSTFFATLHSLGHEGHTIVQVRVSTTLQIVRTWTLDDVHATSISWSKNGMMLLLECKSEFVVLSVDDQVGPTSAAASATSPSSLPRGVVALVKTGMEGLSSVSWVGHANREAVCTFSADDLLANVYDLRDGSILTVANAQRSHVYPTLSSHYVAFLTRINAKDHLVILGAPTSTTHRSTSQRWQVEESFPLQTNHACEVAWSPNERYIAIRDSTFEYKVQIYSPLGHLQSSFQIDSDSAKVETDFVSILNLPGNSSEHRTSGGGLGVRKMKWSPSGLHLALGGHDQRVRILESSEWSMCSCFDLSQKAMLVDEAGGGMGPLMAWREPVNWREETGGRGIICYEQVDMPFSLPSMRIDMSTATSSRSGICWLEWNRDGSLLGVRNENNPTIVFIYAFPSPSSADGSDQRIFPYLLSVIMLASPVVMTAWKPVADAANESISNSSTLAILTSQGQSIHSWTICRPSYDSGKYIQSVEAIPIPLDDFSANHFLYAPDGVKMILTSSEGTYCCAIQAQEDCDDSGDLHESHL